MRKIILLFILFISTSTFAQNLALNELLEIKKMSETNKVYDADNVRSFLFEKSWEILEDRTSMKSRYMIFAYYDKNKVVSFIHISKSINSGRSKVSFQIYNKDIMIDYIKLIEESGAKLIETSDDSFYYLYQDNTNTYEVKEVKDKELFLLNIS